MKQLFLPDEKEFERLRREFTVVPVSTEVVGDLETPVSAFLKLATDEPCFLLESVEQGERWGRYSFIGLDPFLVVRSKDGVVEITGDSALPSEVSDQSIHDQTSPLEVVRRLLTAFRHPDLQGLPPFAGGAVGYLGYDVAGYLEDLPHTTKDDVGAPDLLLMFPGTVLVFDHLRQVITVVANVLGSESYEHACARTERLISRIGEPLKYSPMRPSKINVEPGPSSMTQSEFEEAVERAKEYILAGDIFQVVLSHRFSAPLGAEPIDMYRALRLINPSPYMFFLKHPEITVIGSSPEPLVKVHSGRVIQRPIAGTRPRGKDAEEDAAIEDEFIRDEKERAEHVMLVDLARNDVGRVSRYGSVHVDELMIVERYSHVMHLVSQVSGELAPDRTALDALYASFPAGTVSGAPKIRAMEIIDELEPTKRGPYAGVVGYFDFSGNIDTCIALRTAYVVDGIVHVQAGAGIVADSDASKEWWETVNKAKALLTAVKMAEEVV